MGNSNSNNSAYTPNFRRKANTAGASDSPKPQARYAERSRSTCEERAQYAPIPIIVFNVLTTREMELIKESAKKIRPLEIDNRKESAGAPGSSSQAQLPSDVCEPRPTVLRAFIEVMKATPRSMWSSLESNAQTTDELYRCPKVRAHAARMESFLGSVIDRLNTEKESECAMRIVQLGRRHANFIEANFEAPTLAIFQRAILDAVCIEADETRTAWTKFLTQLLNQMKRGYNAQMFYQDDPRGDAEEANRRRSMAVIMSRRHQGPNGGE